MLCLGCGNQQAYRTFTTATGFECCDKCGALGSLDVPDVYFPGPYIDPNLGHPDRPCEKDGVLVLSKRHKAMLLKEQGLREVGDRRHGAINLDKDLVRRAKEQGHGI